MVTAQISETPHRAIPRKKLTSCHHVPGKPDMMLWHLKFVLLGFDLAFVPFLLSRSLFLPFGMEVDLGTV
jgi:hypothetical protein